MEIKQAKKGYVKNFFPDKGYGFIKSTDKEETDYFARKESIVNGEELKPWQEVKFLPQETDRGPVALMVTVTKDVPEMKNEEPEILKELKGYVKFFDDERGYGFITSTEEEQEDYFVHYDNIVAGAGVHKTLKSAQEVRFLPMDSYKGKLALRVIVTKDVPVLK